MLQRRLAFFLSGVLASAGCADDRFGVGAVSGDAGPVEASLDSSMSDGGTDPCSVPHDVCVTFDDGKMGDPELLPLIDKGSLRVETVARSGKALHASASTGGTAFLARTYQGAPTTLSVSADVRVDSPGTPEVDLFTLIFHASSGDNWRVSIVLSDTGVIRVEESSTAGPYISHDVFSMTAGTWYRLGLDINILQQTVGTVAGAGAATIYVEGTARGAFPISPNVIATSAEAQCGIEFVGAGAGAPDVRVDNLIIDRTF